MESGSVMTAEDPRASVKEETMSVFYAGLSCESDIRAMRSTSPGPHSGVCGGRRADGDTAVAPLGDGGVLGLVSPAPQ